MLIVQHAKVEALHLSMATWFMDHLETDCEIKPEVALRARWYSRQGGEDVLFYLWTKGGRQQYGIRSEGRVSCPVVPAKLRNAAWENGELAWVSWRDIWTSKGGGNFKLKECAFTFFWGRDGIEAISEQLFRAEWPQRKEGGDYCAQPHWQVDWPLENLERSVKKIHFGMAGWECPRIAEEADHCSRHWRRFVADEIEHVTTWAVRTLEYSVDQIASCYPTYW